MAERVTVGLVGWCRITTNDPMVQVVVRFAETETGRLAIAETVVAGRPGVTSDDFRAIRFGRVESWANGQGRDDLRAAIVYRAELTSKARADIDHDERAGADFRADMAAQEAGMMAEAERLGVAERFARGEVAIGAGGTVSEARSAAPLRSRVRSRRLRVPKVEPIPDSFYKEVARIYSDIALSEDGPAKAIAEANGVRYRAVHGWIAEARRRGLLAPGERQARSSR